MSTLIRFSIMQNKTSIIIDYFILFQPLLLNSQPNTLLNT